MLFINCLKVFYRRCFSLIWALLVFSQQDFFRQLLHKSPFLIAIAFNGTARSNTKTTLLDGGFFYLLQKKQHHVFIQNSWDGADNSVITTPPGSSILDRRVTGDLLLASQFMVSDIFALQVISLFSSTLKRVEEKDPPFAPVLSNRNTNKLFLSFGYLAFRGLEVFLGQELFSVLSAKEKKTSDVISSETSYGKAQYRSFKFAIVRRSSAFTSCFYYLMGNSSKLLFSKLASDGSQISGYESLFTPNEYGFAMQMPLSAGTELGIDAAFIEASANSPRSIRGDRIEDDHYRLKVSYHLPIVFGLFANSLVYKSPSYAAAAFADTDHISFTSLTSSLLFGSTYQHFQIGATVGTGSAKTSQTEFNETLSSKTFALILGLQIPW